MRGSVNEGCDDAASHLAVQDQCIVLYCSTPTSSLHNLVGENAIAKQRPTSSASSSGPRLPSITIPIFTGKQDEREPFCDLFRALIHKDNQLSDVERLYYLKKESQIGYGHNPNHGDKLLNTRVYLGGTHENQRLLIQDNISFQLPVGSWDDLFLNIAADYMDPVTRRALKGELERLNMGQVVHDLANAHRVILLTPNFITLFKFLHRRCQSMSSIETTKTTTASDMDIP